MAEAPHDREPAQAKPAARTEPAVAPAEAGATNRAAEAYEGPDPATLRFHIGNAPQVAVAPDPTEEEAASLAAHRATIKVPQARPPFGTDAEGNPRPDPSLAPADPVDPEATAGPATPRAARD